MIIGYQVQDQHGNNWDDRPSYEILTEQTAVKELKLARARYRDDNYNMIVILQGDIEDPTFENPSSPIVGEEKLFPYRVSVYEDKGDKHTLDFYCLASDECHAEEQALDAYPNGEVRHINEVAPEDYPYDIN